MKKILSAIIVAIIALSTAMTLVGCSGTKISNTYLAEEDPVATYTTMAKVDKLEDYVLVNGAGDLFLFEKIDTETGAKTQIVYNLATGAVVLEFADSLDTAYDITIKYLTDINHKAVQYITVKKTTITEDDVTVMNTLYTKAGISIDSVENEEIYNNPNVNLIFVDDSCYRIDEDSNITFAFEQGLAGVPANMFTRESEKYYYMYYQNIISVYDKAGLAISSYKIPSYAGEYAWFVLENGNIFLQYILMADYYSDDYDFMEESLGLKYDIVTKIINPKNGKDKDVDADVVVVGADGDIISGREMTEDWGFNPDLKNVAYGYAVVDKLVDFNNINLYKLTNNGKFVEIKDFAPNAEEVWFEHGHYFVETELGQIFLYTAKNEFVGEISNCYYDYVTDTYIATENAIYDYTLNKVYDLKAGGYSLIGALKNDLILEDEDGEKYIYNGTINKITSETKTAVFRGSWYYTIETTADGITCNVYNTIGTNLGSVNDIISGARYAISTDAILIPVGTSYYRVA